MAARLAPADDDQLHHSVAAGVWDPGPVEAELLMQADRLVGGKDAMPCWWLTERHCRRRAIHSVGVALQYAGALGKQANCQTLVSFGHSAHAEDLSGRRRAHLAEGIVTPTKKAVSDSAPIAAEDILAGETWRLITWRRGTKRALKARFAAKRVCIADGAAARAGTRSYQHLPSEEVWLVGERRASGEQKYYLANLPADADLKTLAATIKARWACEQAY